MKNTKKIIVSSVLATGLLLSSASVNASFSGETVRDKINTTKTQLKNNIKQARETRKEFTKEARNNINTNLKEFRQANKEEARAAFKLIDKETKQELKDLKSKHELIAEGLRKILHSRETTFAEKVEAQKELDKLRLETYNETKRILAGNEKALNVLEKRKEVFEKNSMIRKNFSEKRKEFREKRSKEITKYKMFIVKKIGDRIDKMSEDRLEKLNERVAKFIEKTENNDKISQEQKDKVLSILEGLQDAINEKIDMLNDDGSTSDILDEVTDND